MAERLIQANFFSGIMMANIYLDPEQSCIPRSRILELEIGLMCFAQESEAKFYFVLLHPGSFDSGLFYDLFYDSGVRFASETAVPNGRFQNGLFTRAFYGSSEMGFLEVSKRVVPKWEVPICSPWTMWLVVLRILRWEVVVVRIRRWGLAGALVRYHPPADEFLG